MGAAAAVCIREGKLLMVLQGKPEEDKTWSVPSGQIEAGETYEDCCKREVHEETGYTVEVRTLVHTKCDGNIQYFEVDIENGEPKVQDPDGLIYDISWVCCEKLQELPMTYEEDRDFLLSLLAQD